MDIWNLIFGPEGFFGGPITIGMVRFAFLVLIIVTLIVRIMSDNLSKKITDRAQTPLSLGEFAVFIFLCVADKFDWYTLLGFGAILLMVVGSIVLWYFTHDRS